MKLIKYLLMTEVNHGTKENPDIVQTFNRVEIPCNDSNFEFNYDIAKKEAHNGEVTVEDIPDEVQEPTQADIMEAQLVYTAMMTGTLL